MVVILFEGGEAMTSLPWSSTTNPAGGFGSGASFNPKSPSPLSSSSSSFTTSTLEKSKPLLLLFFFFLVFVFVLVLLFGPVWGLGAALQGVRLRRRVWRLGIWRANWGKGKKERFEERGDGDGDGVVKIEEGEEQYMVWFELQLSCFAVCVLLVRNLMRELESEWIYKAVFGVWRHKECNIYMPANLDRHCKVQRIRLSILFFMLKDSLLLYLILGK